MSVKALSTVLAGNTVTAWIYNWKDGSVECTKKRRQYKYTKKQM